MYAARCAGISLALYLLLYAPISLAVSRGWRLLWRAFKPGSARGSADLLFALRVLPFVVAAIVTLGFTLPSFLLLEPRPTNEAVGSAPLTLGLCCVLLLLAGIVRTVSAQLRTSQALAEWLDGSSTMDSGMMEPGTVLPVFRTEKHGPTLTLTGVREHKVLVSGEAVDVLTFPELRTALRHEAAHARAYDNLKKLLFRFSVFPGMTSLERAWAEQTELAADDGAISCAGDAVDLAAALIKVSRLGAGQSSALLTTDLLHSSTALRERVQRLLAWEKKQPAPTPGLRRWYALPAIASALALIVTAYGPALSGLHAVTEWLVR